MFENKFFLPFLFYTRSFDYKKLHLRVCVYAWEWKCVCSCVCESVCVCVCVRESEKRNFLCWKIAIMLVISSAINIVELQSQNRNGNGLTKKHFVFTDERMKFLTKSNEENLKSAQCYENIDNLNYEDMCSISSYCKWVEEGNSC